MSDIFLRLKNKRAIDVLREVSRPERSDDPVARAIVDYGFRQAAIVHVRPQDEIQERILRIETDTPTRSIDFFLRNQGVANAAQNPDYV